MEFVILLAAIFILGLISIYAYFVIKKEFALTKYTERAHRKIDHHMDRLLETSEKMLNESEEKMKGILAQTHHFNREIEEQSRSIFAQFKDRYVASINAELANVEKQYEEEFYRSMKEVRARLDVKLKEQLEKSDELIGQFTKNEYERVKHEVEEYKKDQEAKMVATIQTLLTKVLEDVVKKSLSREDQKKLILDSLESIKKNSFSHIA